MVRTPSTMLAIGTQAPSFTLPDVHGRVVSSDEAAGPHGLLVMFICNHCPFVKHVADELAAIGRDYLPRGLGIVAINSNDVAAHPADSPEQMVHEVEQRGYTFPYLFDEDQQVAKAYQAACTPDFFLFDGEGRLVYRGQLDDSRPDSGLPVTGSDLRGAIESLLEGGPPTTEQKPSIGCNIKWKPGNEPSYFKTA